MRPPLPTPLLQKGRRGRDVFSRPHVPISRRPSKSNANWGRRGSRPYQVQGFQSANFLFGKISPLAPLPEDSEEEREGTVMSGHELHEFARISKEEASSPHPSPPKGRRGRRCFHSPTSF